MQFLGIIVLVAALAVLLVEVWDNGWVDRRAYSCNDDEASPTSGTKTRDESFGSTGAAMEEVGSIGNRSAAMLATWYSQRCQAFFPNRMTNLQGTTAYHHDLQMWLPKYEVPKNSWVHWPGGTASFERLLTFEDVSVPLNYRPCNPIDLDIVGCASSIAAAGLQLLLRRNGPWDRWCMPFFVRTPIREVKVATLATSDGQQLLFIPNWKAASTTARTLLKTNYFQEYVDPHHMKRQNCPHGLGRCCKHSSATVGDLDAYKTFSFVRDPMDRFLASVRENGEWNDQNMELNMRLIRQEAKRLLRFPYRERGCRYATQAYLLSGTDSAGKPLKLDFLGRVEEFDNAWDHIGAWLGMNLTSISSSTRLNPSGTKMVKDLVRKLAASQTEIACAVCHTYLQDYACFGYDVPAPCCDETCRDHGIFISPAQLELAGCPQKKTA